MPPVANILILLCLILINSLFALSEAAVISARKTRLQQSVDNGRKSAKAALALAGTPTQFLLTVRALMAFIIFLVGAISGLTLTPFVIALLPWLAAFGRYADLAGLLIVAVTGAYITFLIGELVPKQIALTKPEQFLETVAPLMTLFTTLFWPVLFCLNLSANLLLRLLNIKPNTEPPATEDEIKIMLEQGTELGLIEPMEEEMVSQVFRLGDLKASALITPRTEIVWLDLNDTPDDVRDKIVQGGHSIFPVARDRLDNIVGVVRTKDLLARILSNQTLDLKAAIQPALFIPESMPVFDVLERFKEARTQLALVIDEYGGLEGLVTTKDILETLVGDMPEAGEIVGPGVVEREDGSFLLDGMLPIDRFKALFFIEEMPDEGERYYQTLAGFIIAKLGRIPAIGDKFTWNDLIFEVTGMDRHRVERVLVKPIKSAEVIEES